MLRLLLAAVLAATPIAAAARPPARPAPTTATAIPAWTVDPAASRLTYSSRFNDQAFTGAFQRWTAQIRFDPQRLAQSSIVATIDMASSHTGSADRDQSLPTSDWFSVQAFPTATFRSSQIRAAGPGRYEAVGVLTLRGLSRPLTLPFALTITGQGASQTARASASIGLNRMVFGVGQGPWARDDVVPATVTVNLVLAARRAS